MGKDNYKIMMRDDFARAIYVIKDIESNPKKNKESGDKEKCALLSKMEYTVLMSLMSKVDGFKDTRFTEYSFTKTEFLKEMNIGSNLSHEEVYSLLERIGSYRFRVKSIADNGDELLTSYAFLPKVQKNLTQGTYTVKLHEDLMPFLLKKHDDNNKNDSKKKPHFFTMLLKYPLSLKSPYSIALYNFLKSYDFLDVTPVMLERLKDLFSYSQTKNFKFKDFKRDVLEKSIKEINEKTDLKISYSLEYRGRSVTKVVFAINKGTEIPVKPAVKRSKTNRKKASNLDMDQTQVVDIIDEENKEVKHTDVDFVAVTEYNAKESEVFDAITELMLDYKDAVIPPAIIRQLIKYCGENIKLVLASIYRALVMDGNLTENIMELMVSLTSDERDMFECTLLMDYDSLIRKERERFIKNKELSQKEDVKRVYMAYEALIGGLNKKTMTQINESYDTYYAYQIIGAIEKAAKSGGKSFAYVLKILKGGAQGDRENNLFANTNHVENRVNNQTDLGFKTSGLTRQEVIDVINKYSNSDSTDTDEAFDFSVLTR